jgi:UDP-4-amino-4-deoxy-L-arabinose formyltransferase/UDP-glucuronic acid dehydrogenase (UDP-4-keto-hexauronic acid decarboxylating)
VDEARCVVFAYHEMGYACLEALLGLGAPVVALFTHSDDPAEIVWWRSCAAMAGRLGLPVYVVDRALDATDVARVASLQPDIIYSFYYRALLADAVLKSARIGAFNLHGSLLPAYRGRAPVNWVLINGEQRTGVTLHHMVAEADAGDIVAQCATEISDDDTALTLYQRLVAMGARMVREWHPRIVAGTAPRFPQDHARATYFGRRRPEDGRIRWIWPARQIFNLVRAVTHPYPGAFCFALERKLFVWRARVARENGRWGEPGTIVGADDARGIEVAAGTGSLSLLSVQPEGGAEMPAASLLEQGLLRYGCKLM